MAGSTPTHIPIPKNHADFERKAVVLFREILKDPSVKRLGRDGQEQFGVDLVGYRGEKISKVVGIQCKKKAPTSTLTEAEVRAEVKKALTYSPKLQEYIIITSAKNDTALDQLAQKLSQAQAKKGRKIRIEVWGWGHSKNSSTSISALDKHSTPDGAHRSKKFRQTSKESRRP
jgi:hypothetical protein